MLETSRLFPEELWDFSALGPSQQPNKVENFFITYRKYFHSAATASPAPRSKPVLAAPSESAPAPLAALSGGRSRPPPPCHPAVIVPPPPRAPQPGPARPGRPPRSGPAAAAAARDALHQPAPRSSAGPRGRRRGARCQSPRGARAARLRIRPPPRAGSAGGAGGGSRGTQGCAGEGVRRGLEVGPRGVRVCWGGLGGANRRGEGGRGRLVGC